MISSSPGRVIALDLHEYVTAVARLENAIEFQLDDEEMFRFIMDNMEFENSAMEELEISLISLAGPNVENTPGLTVTECIGQQNARTDAIVYFCHQYGQKLLEELQAAGAYDQDGILNYHYEGRLLPKTAFLKEKEFHYGDLTYPEV